MTEVHNCKDGSIGVADFSGIPKGGKEMNYDSLRSPIPTIQRRNRMGSGL